LLMLQQPDNKYSTLTCIAHHTASPSTLPVSRGRCCSSAVCSSAQAAAATQKGRTSTPSRCMHSSRRWYDDRAHTLHASGTAEELCRILHPWLASHVWRSMLLCVRHSADSSDSRPAAGATGLAHVVNPS
jgi:hypothetical protein